jgi:hypothetical protein
MRGNLVNYEILLEKGLFDQALDKERREKLPNQWLDIVITKLLDESHKLKRHDKIKRYKDYQEIRIRYNEYLEIRNS